MAGPSPVPPNHPHPVAATHAGGGTYSPLCRVRSHLQARRVVGHRGTPRDGGARRPSQRPQCRQRRHLRKEGRGSERRRQGVEEGRDPWGGGGVETRATASRVREVEGGSGGDTPPARGAVRAPHRQIGGGAAAAASPRGEEGPGGGGGGAALASAPWLSPSQPSLSSPLAPLYTRATATTGPPRGQVYPLGEGDRIRASPWGGSNGRWREGGRAGSLPERRGCRAACPRGSNRRPARAAGPPGSPSAPGEAQGPLRDGRALPGG